MNWKSFCFIVSGAIIQAIGVALLKNGIGSLNTNAIQMIPAFILMIIGFPLYNQGLRRTKLSVAQPLFSTTLFLSCTLLSLIVLHETIRVNQIFGIVIILIGVVAVISADEKNVLNSKN
jgi:drug/metabolite transporter (DMT)-like permease